MKEMRGRYPGGPSRRETGDPEAPKRGKVHLETVGEFETMLARGSRRHRTQRRRKRRMMGLAVSVVVAMAVGGYIGFSTHRTDSEVAQEMDQRNNLSKGEVEQQMNRLIDEMWKSEALEKAPHIR